TISVLGAAVSMRSLYTMSMENDTLYSASFSSKSEINDEKIEEIFSNVGSKEYDLKTTVLKAQSTSKEVESRAKEEYIILSYDQFIEILKNNGNEKELNKIDEEMVTGNKVIYIQRPGTFGSLIEKEEITIADKVYEISEGDIRFKTLGSLLNDVTIVVNDEEYEKIKASSEELNFYGIKITNDEALLDLEIMNEVTTRISPYLSQEMRSQVGLYKLQGVAWLKMVYAIGAFLFLVFVLAEASIIYTKIYSDANEDKNKYKILSNVGASKKDLERAINKEVALFYSLPIAVGLIDSFFAIKALGDILSDNLLGTFILSMGVCSGIFILSYMISIRSFKKIVKVSEM
ncbi:MAG: ABC transporter permease, partial [Cellulosilyticaceae bacterium]